MSLPPDKLLTTHEVGALVQVDPSSIVKWINDGILPSFKTPGRHRRVKVSDLIAFMRHHQMYIPTELEGQKRVVLVSEAEKTLRTLAHTFEGHPEVVVEPSSSAIGALVGVGAQPPDALVVDVDVKALDPFKIASSIAGATSTKKVPVILIAEAPGPTLQRRAQGLGATALVSPSVAAEEVLGILAKVRA